MMSVSIQVGTCDLEDEDLQLMCQLGVDCLDFTQGSSFAGVADQGYPDLDRLLGLKKRIRAWGMEMNRVTLPDISDSFMLGSADPDGELDRIGKALQVFAEAGMPIARLRLGGDVIPESTSGYRAYHRGGAVVRGERAADQRHRLQPSPEQTAHWWERFDTVFRHLVPIADESGIKLAIHPSDSPYPGTPFDGIGLHRVIDRFPSRQVGLIYCVGTRAEAGGGSLVLDEIHQFGRKERIFLVHLRNVRGSLTTAGAFEEALLDEGDLNMPKVLLALRKVGFGGCLNPDHMPGLAEGLVSDAHPNKAWRSHKAAWSYSIGYIKGLLAAMDEFAG